MAQTPINDRDIRFRDGLGLRVVTTDASGDAVEQLRLPTELAVQESSIRERVGRLVNFRHVKYVRLRGVDRLKQGGKELVVSYDAVDGDRLSTILESAAKIPLTVDVDVALQIVRDLLPGIGILHDSRKVTHGAIGPERIAYTTQHRLIILDHGLGLALGRLNQPRKKLWEQYRIAVPGSARGVFDERTDVVQIGIVALSALLARPLTDEEYPAQLKRLILSVKEHTKHGARPISPELRQWLERALPVDEDHAFRTVRDAQDAFEALVGKGRYAPSAAAVKAFLTRYREATAALAAEPAPEAATTKVREPRGNDVERALEEFAITIGPKAPVSRSKSTLVVEAAPPSPIELPAAAQTPAQADAPAMPAEAARTLVIASAIEGNGPNARLDAPTSATPLSEAPRAKSTRRSDRLSESPLARQRVGDAARRARQSTLRGDVPRPAAVPADASADQPAAAAPRRTGRLDALRALEEELSRLAALDLVMPRHQTSLAAPPPVAEAPVSTTSAPAIETAAMAVPADVTPISGMQVPLAVVAEALEAAATLSSEAAGTLATPPGQLPAADASVEAPISAEAAVEVRVERRPFRTDAIDAELAELMGDRDADECATPIWTIEGAETGGGAASVDLATLAGQPAAEAVVELTLPPAEAAPIEAAALMVPPAPAVAELAPSELSADAIEAMQALVAFEAAAAAETDAVAFEAVVDVAPETVVAASETVPVEPLVEAAQAPAFELTSPTTTPGLPGESFELTAPAFESHEIERPMLLELSAFEQAAADIYAAAAQMRGSARLFDAEPATGPAPTVSEPRALVAADAVVEVRPAAEAAFVEMAIAEPAIADAAIAESEAAEWVMAESAIVESAILASAVAEAAADVATAEPTVHDAALASAATVEAGPADCVPATFALAESAITDPANLDGAPVEFTAVEFAVADSAIAETVIAETAIEETALAETAIVEPAIVRAAIVEPAIADATSAETAIAETAIVETAIAEPAIADTTIIETAIVEFAIADAAIAESAIAEPATVDSTVADADIVVSAIVEAAIVEPAIAEPAIAEPAIAELAVAEPAIVEPAIVEPALAESEIADLAIVEPLIVATAIANPAIASAIVESAVAAPAIVEPAIAETTIAETAIAQTAIAEAAIAEPAIEETEIALTAIAEPALAETAIAEPALAETAIVEPVFAETAVVESAALDPASQAAAVEPASDETSTASVETPFRRTSSFRDRVRGFLGGAFRKSGAEAPVSQHAEVSQHVDTEVDSPLAAPGEVAADASVLARGDFDVALPIDVAFESFDHLVADQVVTPVAQAAPASEATPVVIETLAAESVPATPIEPVAEPEPMPQAAAASVPAAPPVQIASKNTSRSKRKRSRNRNKRRREMLAPVQHVGAPPVVLPAIESPAAIHAVTVAPETVAETVAFEAIAAVEPPAVGEIQPAATAGVRATQTVAAAGETVDRVTFYEFDASAVADAVPAWARGTAGAEATQDTAGDPQPIGDVQFQSGSADAGSPVTARAAWETRHDAPPVPSYASTTQPYAPSALPANVVPFQPQAERESYRDASDAAPSYVAPKRRSLVSRVNWGRTLAASLVLAMLEGVAFAAAWWYVTPTELGWLVVHTRPAGIEISIDGMSRGQTPFAVSLRPGRHTIELRQGTAARVVPVEISAGVQTEQRITWGKAFKTGQARITSTPEGAHVLIDGKSQGRTPLTVSELAAGKHSVMVEASSGSVSSSLIIEPGETTELDVPVYSGWVSVLSPVELEIFERGRLIGTTEADKIMLAPGTHKLELKSDSLGYQGAQTVEVRPGATTAVSILPTAVVTVEGPRGAELFVDGERAGALPIEKLQTPIGTREFVFKHPEQGERRQIVVVTMTTPVVVRY